MCGALRINNSDRLIRKKGLRLQTALQIRTMSVRRPQKDSSISERFIRYPTTRRISEQFFAVPKVRYFLREMDHQNCKPEKNPCKSGRHPVILSL
jgi:hypothetical protein